MQATQFDRDAMATWYANEHLSVDPGLQTIYYLRSNAPNREIRLLEVNTMMVERTDDALEPIDFGVAVGADEAHTLMVLDVTPAQWQRIEQRRIPLPQGWSLTNAIPFHKP